MYNSFLVLGCQVLSVRATIKLQARPFDIEDIDTNDVKDTYYIMATLGRDFRNMIYFDSFCVFLCVANAIMHFRRVWFFINLWLNALQTAAGLIIGNLIIY